ncbi:MAG: response regulator transcription factor [Chloroflexi bacterium]|nr:MAG: response regulator transcription factor [Chloroflexota bacterium]
MARIRLLIVDDHEVVRLGMRAAFELEPDINVVGEASDGAEALAKMSVLAPQLILMDVRMERMSGIEACREIKSLYPDVSILMITSYTDNEAVLASMLAGASGYLLKNLSRAELLRSIRLVASGQSLLDPELVKQATSWLTALASSGSQTQGGELTEREREVLVLIARGYTNKQIANTLIVTEKTARNHVSHILEKLGLARRSEAAAFAVEHKLVPPFPPTYSPSRTITPPRRRIVSGTPCTCIPS